jgi:hypothetical protein
VSALLVVAGCRQESSEKVFVSVGDSHLTESRLMAALPPNVTPTDSAIIIDEFIRRWVLQQVLLQKAQLNLSDVDQDIDAAVDEYRTSLIVERYQQKVVASFFNPVITDSAIIDYYEDMKHNFKLHDNIIKGVFAVVPDDAKVKSRIKKLLSYDNAAELEQYLFKNASKYEISMDKWMPMSYVRSYMPKEMLKNEQSVLRSKKLTEYVEGDNAYYFLVTDHIFSDGISPLEFVKDQIYTILLNREKIMFIKKIKSELLDEAHKNNSIKYYNNN